MAFCSNCGQKNSPESNYCAACGIDQIKAVSISPLPPEQKYCHSCGGGIRRQNNYCGSCGIDLLKVTSEKVKTTDSTLNISQITGIQDVLNIFKGLGDSSVMIRSLYGALGAVIGGIIIASIIGLIMDAATPTDPLTELVISPATGNPLFIFPIANGAPFFYEIGFSALGHDEVISTTLRVGSLVLLLLPFAVLFAASIFNLKYFTPQDMQDRLRMALGQGVAYGLILTVLAVIMGSLFDFDFDIPLGMFGGGMPDVGVIGSSGFLFFGTLLITIFWGCLFSLAGYLYPEIKFNYAKLTEYINIPYKQGLTAAFNVIGITVILAIVASLALIAWQVVEADGMQSFGDWLMLPLIIIQLIPVVILTVWGAPLLVSVPGEEMYFSMWRGYGAPGADIAWEWYFLLLMLLPIILSFIGGHIAQKRSSMETQPWQNALSFSLFITVISFVLVLTAQVTMQMDMGQLMQMAERMQGEELGMGMTAGFTMLRSLFSIFVFSIIGSMLGAYQASSQG